MPEIVKMILRNNFHRAKLHFITRMESGLTMEDHFQHINVDNKIRKSMQIKY